MVGFRTDSRSRTGNQSKPVRDPSTKRFLAGVAYPNPSTAVQGFFRWRPWVGCNLGSSAENLGSRAVVA